MICTCLLCIYKYVLFQLTNRFTIQKHIHLLSNLSIYQIINYPHTYICIIKILYNKGTLHINKVVHFFNSQC